MTVIKEKVIKDIERAKQEYIDGVVKHMDITHAYIAEEVIKQFTEYLISEI